MSFQIFLYQKLAGLHFTGHRIIFFTSKDCLEKSSPTDQLQNWVYFPDLSRSVNERNQLSTYEGRNSWDSCDHDKVIHVSSIKYLKNNVCHWGSSACYVYYFYCFASVRWSLRLKELSQSKLRQSCLGLGLWPRPVKPLSHTLYN